MPYFFASQHDTLFLFRITNMNVAVAKAEALSICRTLLPSNATYHVAVCDVYGASCNIEAIKPPMLLNQAEDEPVIFGVELRPNHDSAISDRELAHFKERFEQHFCRRIEVTDLVDQIVLTTSISFGSTLQLAG